MRLAFIVLCVINAAFAAYVLLLRGADDPAARIARLQVSPETIRVVPQPGSGRADASADAAVACLEWSAFTGGDVARADAALAALNLPGLAVQRVTSDVPGFWVYVPPLKVKADIDKRLAALKARGLQDVHVVQESGPRNNAISLGIFRTEEAARVRLEAVKAAGIGDATVERREQLLKQVSYYLREPDTATVGKLAELHRDFAGTDVKAVRCPALEKASG